MLSIGPRQQLIDIAVGVTIDDAREDVGQIRERVDVVQLAGLDQGRDGGPMLGASVGTGEQRVLPAERDRADGALDSIVVEFDAAIADVGMSGPQAMGKVMALVKPRLAGRADMSRVSGLVKQRLG